MCNPRQFTVAISQELNKVNFSNDKYPAIFCNCVSEKTVLGFYVDEKSIQISKSRSKRHFFTTDNCQNFTVYYFLSINPLSK